MITTLSGHKVAVWPLIFIDSGKNLLSRDYGGNIIIWDVQTWELVRTIQPEATKVRGLCLSPNENILALSLEGAVQLWDFANWQMIAEIPISTKAINGMAFSPDGQILAIGAADKKIRVWDIG